MAKWIDPLADLMNALEGGDDDEKWYARSAAASMRRRGPDHIHRWKERISGSHKGCEICELCGNRRYDELGRAKHSVH